MGTFALIALAAGALLLASSRKKKKTANGGTDPAPTQAKDIIVEGVENLGPEYSLLVGDTIAFEMFAPPAVGVWEVMTGDPAGPIPYEVTVEGRAMAGIPDTYIFKFAGVTAGTSDVVEFNLIGNNGQIAQTAQTVIKVG